MAALTPWKPMRELETLSRRQWKSGQAVQDEEE